MDIWILDCSPWHYMVIGGCHILGRGGFWCSSFYNRKILYHLTCDLNLVIKDYFRFLWQLQQITRNSQAQHTINLLPHNLEARSSDVSFTGPRSKCWQGHASCRGPMGDYASSSLWWLLAFLGLRLYHTTPISASLIILPSPLCLSIIYLWLTLIKNTYDYIQDIQDIQPENPK